MTTSIMGRTTRVVATLMLGAGLMLSGCKSKQAQTVVRNQDGSITNADGSVTYPAGSQQAQQAEQAKQSNTPPPAGAVANPDGSATYPNGSQQAQGSAAAPAGPAPAPTPATATAPAPAAPSPAAPVQRPAVVVPSGSRVEVSLSETLSASKNNAGDRFTGVLARPITTSGGGTAFARGTRVEGTVVAAKGRGKFKGAGGLGIELTSIAGQNVSTTEYEKAEKGKGKRTAGFIGGGGGAGALIGGLAGGGKGALIGGLLGAGGGTAAGAFTGNKDIVIPAETVVLFRTTSEIRVRR